MILSRSKGYIFIHIPKTGGSAWSTLLSKGITWQDLIVGATPVGEIFNSAWAPRFGIHKHLTISQLADIIGVDELRKYVIISIVRHPIRRFLSSYNFIRTLENKQTSWAVGLLQKHRIHGIKNIDDMLSSQIWNDCENLALKNADELQKFFLPQHLFLDFDLSSKVKLEVFKLESFEAAKDRLAELGILSRSDTLTSTNESIKFGNVIDLNQGHLKEIYSHYEADFKQFGYAIEDVK